MSRFDVVALPPTRRANRPWMSRLGVTLGVHRFIEKREHVRFPNLDAAERKVVAVVRCASYRRIDFQCVRLAELGQARIQCRSRIHRIVVRRVDEEAGGWISSAAASSRARSSADLYQLNPAPEKITTARRSRSFAACRIVSEPPNECAPPRRSCSHRLPADVASSSAPRWCHPAPGVRAAEAVKRYEPPVHSPPNSRFISSTALSP